MYPSLFVCMYICMYVCMYICKYVCLYAGMYVGVHICLNFHMQKNICRFACMHDYISLCEQALTCTVGTGFNTPLIDSKYVGCGKHM